jgi:hypothetical protein
MFSRERTMFTRTAALTAALALAGTAAPAQTLVGRPCLFSDYFAEWRNFPVILRDADGNLSCGGHRLNNGGATQGPPAAGAVAATAVRRCGRGAPQGHFTYRDAAGAVQDLWFERWREHDRWHVQQLNRGGGSDAPAAAGDPSGLEREGVFHVVYRDLEGAVQELRNDQGWQVRALNLGGATGAPAAAGDPVQVVANGVRHVLYRDLEGGIRDLADRADGWRADLLNLGGRTGAPPAAGDPAVTADWTELFVTYRDREGGIQDLGSAAGWQARRLNCGGATAAPPAQGDPCARLVDHGRRHLTYRDRDGWLQDLWFDDGWRVQQLNGGGRTDAPRAQSDPAALVPASGWEYVDYVDEAGRAQLLSHFLDNPWQAARLR